MKTPAENQPEKATIRSRQQAETAGFTISGDKFDQTARDVLESFRADLIDGEIIIVDDGDHLRLAFRGANNVAISALLIRVAMRVRRAAKETERMPVPPSPPAIDSDIGSATKRIIDTARNVRDTASGSFKRPKPPQQ